MKVRIVRVLSLLLGILAPTVFGQPPMQSTPLWSLDLPGIRAVALAESLDCVAVATTDRISLLSRTGTPLWHWDYRKGNRFMQVGEIAVAPSCDWLVASGTTAYRYTWIAHRDGRLFSIPSTATPLGVAIGSRSDLLALGTGAGEVWLLDSSGRQRWKRATGICCVQALSFADSDRSIVVEAWGSALLSIDGKLLWSGGGNGMRASQDLKRFVTWSSPPHGPGFGRVSLLDSDGKPLWERYALLGPESIIAPDGEIVIAPVSENQSPREEEGFADSPFHSAPHFLRALSAAGEILHTFEIDATPVRFNARGDRFLLRTHEGFEVRQVSGDSEWGGAFPRYSLPRIDAAGDLSVVVVSSPDRLSWFSAPR